MNYYNENDPKAAAWLRELIKNGCISEGVVDERSIVDVQSADLVGYNQCHFFAGIGGWSYALRLAGVPDDEPVWTGSCPCQPFSVAGKQKGTADIRHLWPVFFRLIAECQPSVVFGEQVASKAGRGWLTGVFADLESVAYAGAGADLCAAGVRSPNIRQRLYWVADSIGERRAWEHSLLWQKECGRDTRTILETTGSSTTCKMATGRVDNASCGRDIGQRQAGPFSELLDTSKTCNRGMADTDGGNQGNGGIQRSREHGQQQENSFPLRLEHTESDRWKQWWTEPSERSLSSRCRPWDDFQLLPCTDGKARRIEPGSFPLAHGVSGRVGLLRGYGNAIVPQVAAEFISAFYEARNDV